jgi:hypothetical protein
MQIYEGSIKEEDKKRDKIFISGMITHESDKGMCLAMITRENFVIFIARVKKSSKFLFMIRVSDVYMVEQVFLKKICVLL